MRKSLKITMASDESAAECFERFLLTKRSDGVKSKTIESYTHHFHSISKHLDTSLDITELTSEHLRDMIISMQDASLSPNTIKSYTITLKAFLSWCNREGITELNMKKYKGVATIKETYSDDELKALLQKPNMKKCTFSDYRNYVIVNFLINSGCRAATVRNIQNRDVDIDNRIVYARHTKNSKPLVIPLCSQMIELLRQYMKIRGGAEDEYLFCSEYGEYLTENALRLAIARYNKSRGIQKTSIHLFRHTFARKYLIDCGGDAFTLQKLLGHSTLDMTKLYCTIFDADIAKNYDEISPLARIKATSTKIKMDTSRK